MTGPRLTRDCRDPFRGGPQARLGHTTLDRLRGPDFVRLGPNLYVGAATEIDVRVRVLMLSEWAGGRGVVAGPLAALSWGAQCPWEDAEIVVPGHRRLVVPDVRLRADRLHPDEIAERHGVPMTTPLRTALDLARRPPLAEAVAAVDALGFRCRFGADALRPLVERHPRLRGIVQARRVLELMDPRAQSPMESRTRLIFHGTDVPPPLVQHRVYLPDGRWKDLDLAWKDVPAPNRKVGLEYDGAEHRSVAGQNRDYLRDAELDAIGWETLRVSSLMIYDEIARAALVERIRRRVV